MNLHDGVSVVSALSGLACGPRDGRCVSVTVDSGMQTTPAELRTNRGLEPCRLA